MRRKHIVHISSFIIQASRRILSKRRFVFILLAGTTIFYLGFLLSSQPQVFHKSKRTGNFSSVLPKEVSVELSDEGFSPKEVTISLGTAVRWKNTSGAAQTVNSDDYPTNQKYKELNFGVFQDGSTFVYVFDQPGTYGYHNQLHPEQAGKIIVTK